MGLGRSFWGFWAATGFTNAADGMVGLAVVLVALQLTRSPLQISALELCEGLPWLLFGLVAGVIADRVDRRRLMVLAQLVRVGLLLLVCLVLIAGKPPLWLLYLVTLAMGVAETLFDTSAQSVVPGLVRAESFEAANSRLQGVEVVTRYFVGPPLGGLIVGVASAAAFATGSGMYLAAGLVVLTVRGRFRAERVGPPASVRTEMAEGLRFLRDHLLLRRIALLSGARMITFSAVGGVLPVYAVSPGPMHLSSRGYGLFIASTAIGAVLSSVTGERAVGRLGAARCLHLTMIAFAVTELSPLAVNPFLVGALWMVGTYFVIIWNVITLSLRQRLVPEHLLGRTNAVFRVVTWGAVPLGAALGGAVAEAVGPRPTFVVFGLLTALLALGTRPLTDQVLTTGQLPASGRAGRRRGAADPPATDGAATDRAATDRAVTDRAVTDRTAVGPTTVSPTTPGPTVIGPADGAGGEGIGTVGNRG